MGTTKASTKRGNLRIGDQWNAITIIARSQTHPLKAVCELVENAIDANAADVHLVRRRRRGESFLEVWDDGNGVACDDAGQPDFNRIATHVCDSMKRHLGEKERDGVHGEFGIGMLSFWSLGEELRFASAGRDGRVHEMTLKRGKRSYNVRPVRGELPTGGARVVIGPLVPTTRSIVTGEKLQRYLATELRDRIRNTGVRIRITDRVSRKNLVVVPREFEGDRLDVPSRVKTPHGHLTVELYARPGGAGEGGIAVCKDGTRVLRNLTDLHALQRAPWDDGRLEGVLDFPAFNLAPGTRSGIVPDERLQAFLAAVCELEESLKAALEQWDQAESDKASRQILKQVHRAFVHALRELPANEYLFFDIPKFHAAAQLDSAPSGGNGRPMPEGNHTSAGDEETHVEQPVLYPAEPGPLASVAIRPRTVRRIVGEECSLSATARDAQGVAIPDGVQFHWQLRDGQAQFSQVEGPRCRITSQHVGIATIGVTAVQDEQQAEAECVVKFLEGVSAEDRDSIKGLPSYRLEADRGAHWRSRYDVLANEIVINSAHRDFLASKQTGAKHRRYIGKLYGKEVVLINFAHESPMQVMDRLIEVLVRTEDAL